MSSIVIYMPLFFRFFTVLELVYNPASNWATIFIYKVIWLPDVAIFMLDWWYMFWNAIQVSIALPAIFNSPRLVILELVVSKWVNITWIHFLIWLHTSNLFLSWMLLVRKWWRVLILYLNIEWVVLSAILKNIWLTRLLNGSMLGQTLAVLSFWLASEG